VARVPAAELDFPTSPERTFAVLSEPQRYGFWVVGAHQVEDADASWPAPGASFHHEQGLPLLNLDDTTTVLECEPPTHLRLEARVRPFLVAHVDLRLTPTEDGTRVRMHEEAVGGVLAPLLRLPPARALTRLRNLESLRRLRKAAVGGA